MLPDTAQSFRGTLYIHVWIRFLNWKRRRSVGINFLSNEFMVATLIVLIISLMAKHIFIIMKVLLIKKSRFKINILEKNWANWRLLTISSCLTFYKESVYNISAFDVVLIIFQENCQVVVSQPKIDHGFGVLQGSRNGVQKWQQVCFRYY